MATPVHYLWSWSASFEQGCLSTQRISPVHQLNAGMSRWSIGAELLLSWLIFSSVVMLLSRAKTLLSSGILTSCQGSLMGCLSALSSTTTGKHQGCEYVNELIVSMKWLCQWRNCVNDIRLFVLDKTVWQVQMASECQKASWSHKQENMDCVWHDQHEQCK